jgi:glycine oxidase
MTTPPPIVVLGGGLMGLAIAHQLARRGHAVRVISRNRNEAAGFVAAGMLAPHAEGLSGQLLTLGQHSLALIPQWVAQIEHDSGLTCGLRMSGNCGAVRYGGRQQALPDGRPWAVAQP